MNTENNEDYRSVLSSVDRQGRRTWLFVDIVRGRWRQRRQILAAFLVTLYLLAPFVHINGGPLLRIDIPNRHYILCGQVFWPQDLSYALMFVLLFLIGTLLMVSLCGRVICGWLCPHNVFLELVFRPLERIFSGPAHRQRVRSQPGNVQHRISKIRTIMKYVVYMCVVGALTNAATAIFVGSESFIWGIVLDPFAHPSAAIFYVIFYALIFFNFTWFREQTCTLVCPYGRLQTAMLDSDTLTVAYDQARGEPRGKPRQLDTGDCVDCRKCVNVCPTGIDIRNGNQMECIHCTACIDACNDVMSRLQRPVNLIGYKSEAMLNGGQRRIIRPRTLLYAVVFIVLAVVTYVRVSQRPLIDIVLLRQHTAPQIIQLHDERYIQIAVPLSFVNKSTQDKEVHLSLVNGVGTVQQDVAQIITQFNPLHIPAQQRSEQVLYIRMRSQINPSLGNDMQLRIVYDDSVYEYISLPALNAPGAGVIIDEDKYKNGGGI